MNGPDDWSEVSVTGGVRPPGSTLPGLVYDSVTKKLIQFGAYTNSSALVMETYAYDVPTKTWRKTGNYTIFALLLECPHSTLGTSGGKP